MSEEIEQSAAENETAPSQSAEVVAEAPKKRAAAPKVVLTKYTVINGAIAPNGGGRANLVQPGEVVELTPEQAKHFNKLGYLKPYMED